jgi:hypothetical protein
MFVPQGFYATLLDRKGLLCVDEPSRMWNPLQKWTFFFLHIFRDFYLLCVAEAVVYTESPRLGTLSF